MTKKGALRCLKRYLARRIHRLLAEPPADQQQAAEPQPIVEPQAPTIDGKLPGIPERPEPLTQTRCESRAAPTYPLPGMS